MRLFLCRLLCRSLSRPAPVRSGRFSGGIRAGQVLLVLFVALILAVGSLAAAGALVAVSAYNHYAAGLPDPKVALANIDFEQQTVLYDRTGKTVGSVELSDDGLSGEVVNRITDPRFQVPTTVARFGNHLYLPNARFGTPPTPDTVYTADAISSKKLTG